MLKGPAGGHRVVEQGGGVKAVEFGGGLGGPYLGKPPKKVAILRRW